MTQEQAAERVGKSRPAVANALRLLQLPEHIAALVSDRELSAGHGRAVLSLKDPVKQDKLVQLILQDNLSVREAEKLAAQKRSSPRRTSMWPSWKRICRAGPATRSPSPTSPKRAS